jgi:hypothetical protein
MLPAAYSQSAYSTSLIHTTRPQLQAVSAPLTQSKQQEHLPFRDLSVITTLGISFIQPYHLCLAIPRRSKRRLRPAPSTLKRDCEITESDFDTEWDLGLHSQLQLGCNSRKYALHAPSATRVVSTVS